MNYHIWDVTNCCSICGAVVDVHKSCIVSGSCDYTQRRLTKTRMQLLLSSNNVKLCRHDHIDAFKNIFVTSQPATNADVQKSFVVLSSRDGTYRHLTNTPMHLLPGSNKVKLCRHNHIGAFRNLWVPSARILMCRTFADFILSSLCTILHDTCASTSKHLPPSAPP